MIPNRYALGPDERADLAATCLLKAAILSVGKPAQSASDVYRGKQRQRGAEPNTFTRVYIASSASTLRRMFLAHVW